MSAIEWTDVTWNPVTGCSKVSPGCANCYAETVARRFPARFADPFLPWTPENAEHNVRLHPDRLEQPLRWRKPRRVFVNSMSDLFHEQVPFEFIERVYDVMGEAEQHTFQVLTKRPERALEFWRHFADCDHGGAPIAECRYCAPWTNVWLGVSIENARHTYRADVLRQIPAAVLFISAEPLLGSLVRLSDDCALDARVAGRSSTLDLTGIDWLIVGGESGPGARPMSLEWARELVRACRDTGTACFVKQLGAKPVGGMDVGTSFYLPLKSRKGGDPCEWPPDLRIREWPS